MSESVEFRKNLVVNINKSLDAAKSSFGKYIQECSNSAISTNGEFNIAVSGGSLVNALVEILPNIKTDFTKWKIFFCDERIVPFDDPESTYGLYKKLLIGKIPLTEENFITVDPRLDAPEAAIDYDKKLRNHFPKSSNPNYFPRFDCLLLGLGPDGHTCSLFPDHPLLNEKKLWIAHISNSPKPPPKRITITFPIINHAKCILLYLTGEGKADIVKRILNDNEKLPGYYIKTTLPDSPVVWILDPGSSKLLPKQ